MNKHCKYHPLDHAAFYCPRCEINTCSQCSKENLQLADDSCQCFNCNGSLDVISDSSTITPFWRQLEPAFLYPANKQAVAVMVLSALTALTLFFLPFLAIFSIILITKYSFSCLESTANGKMTAPSLNEAYQGVPLFLKLLAMSIITCMAIYFTGQYIGLRTAIFILFFSVVTLPASIIILAIENDIREAINPLRLLQVMTAIGAPYGLLLIIAAILSSSIGIINFLIGDSFTGINFFLQVLVSNYYTIVFFHLLGYVVFQYQEELGHHTETGHHKPAKRPAAILDKMQAEIHLKEGRYEQAIALYQKNITSNPQNYELHDNYFRLLIALKEQKKIESFADRFLQLLLDRGQRYQLGSTLQQLNEHCSNYRPQSAELRLTVAQLQFDKGDFKGAVNMLNGYHKDFPKHPSIAKAYTLMAKTMLQLPNMKTQAGRYIQYANRIITTNNTIKS
ncbi:hypothetical protein EDC56_0723 [Sinobacterium caligoides]|uniref:Uncharacterized protein n=1 Tax=Sinobacterium caligoides TaxID=933926 RepID=A0A3N2DZE0_9GAMM|nr:hypothetical protein [Sinobacterium caligoides]ROS05194.1 hypothetical protein EDC56_0723 [Sinobacterium caligoides]